MNPDTNPSQVTIQRVELLAALLAGDEKRAAEMSDEIIKIEVSRLIVDTLRTQCLVTAQRCALRWLAGEGLVHADDFAGIQELLSQNHLPGAFGSNEPEKLKELWKDHPAIAAWKAFREQLGRDATACAPF
jgi:hypothetical protein